MACQLGRGLAGAIGLAVGLAVGLTIGVATGVGLKSKVTDLLDFG